MDVYYCDDKMKIIPFNYIQCCYICDVLAYVDCKRVIVWLDSLSIIKFRHIQKTYGTMLPVLGYGVDGIGTLGKRSVIRILCIRQVGISKLLMHE